ncbi:MAG: V-type ATP synthase subunit F [Thermoplasmata archaeon HGW-Thermoplasmata-1]|nr:MAG: V-type ATP synthase subunit F [Thermoplasmata archaeon HGW-Thermoplasmata-1]
MYKVIVLTDPETADGFRLAGVDVFEVETPQEANKEMQRLLSDDKTGILAVNESFLAGIDGRIKKRIEATYRPIVVSLPVKEKLGTIGERKALLARLVHRAVGFDVTLRNK